MIMEIRGSWGQNQVHDAKRLQEERQKAEEVKKEQREEGQKKTEKVERGREASRDLYIGSEKSPARAKADNPGKAEEKWRGSTDEVDREIRKLKEKQKQLKQQIQGASASGDEKKVGELKKKLAQVEGELRQKDNDGYRRQHTSMTRVE